MKIENLNLEELSVKEMKEINGGSGLGIAITMILLFLCATNAY